MHTYIRTYNIMLMYVCTYLRMCVHTVNVILCICVNTFHVYMYMHTYVCTYVHKRGESNAFSCMYCISSIVSQGGSQPGL